MKSQRTWERRTQNVKDEDLYEAHTMREMSGTLARIQKKMDKSDFKLDKLRSRVRQMGDTNMTRNVSTPYGTQMDEFTKSPYGSIEADFENVPYIKYQETKLRAKKATKRVQELKNILSEYIEQSALQNDVIDKQEYELSTIQSQNDQKDTQLRETVQTIENNASQQINIWEDKEARLTQKNKDLLDTVHRLEGSLAHESTQVNKLENKCQDYEGKLRDVEISLNLEKNYKDKLGEHYENMKTQQDVHHDEEREKLQQRISKQDRQNSKLKQRLDQMEKVCDETQGNNSQMKNTFVDMENKNDELNKKYSTILSEYDALVLNSKDLQKGLDKAYKINDKQKSHIENVLKDNTVNKAESKNKQNEINELEKQFANMDSKLNSYQLEMKKINVEKESLKKSNFDLNEKNYYIQKQIEDMTQTIVKKDDKIMLLGEEIKIFEGDKHVKMTEINRLRDEITELKLKNNNVKQQIDQKIFRINELDTEKYRLENENKDLKGETSVLANNYKDLEFELEKTNKENKTNSFVLGEFEKKADSLVKEIEYLKYSKITDDELVNKHKSQLEKYLKKIEKMEQVNIELKSEKDNLKHTLREIEDRIAYESLHKSYDTYEKPTMLLGSAKKPGTAATKEDITKIFDNLDSVRDKIKQLRYQKTIPNTTRASSSYPAVYRSFHY